MVVAVPKKNVSKKTNAQEDGIIPPFARRFPPEDLSTKQETVEVDPMITPMLKRT
jgi:hypothetical protein